MAPPFGFSMISSPKLDLKSSNWDRLQLPANHTGYILLYIDCTCDIEYEFRTTVVKDYHEIADFHKIGEMIKNAKRYFIQSYKYQDSVRIKTLSAMTKEELQMCLDIVKEYVKNSSLREID